MEIVPLYINHNDFIEAKNSFKTKIFNDFEDLIILHSSLRLKCKKFITNDTKLIQLKKFDSVFIEKIS